MTGQLTLVKHTLPLLKLGGIIGVKPDSVCLFGAGLFALMLNVGNLSQNCLASIISHRSLLHIFRAC